MPTSKPKEVYVPPAGDETTFENLDEEALEKRYYEE
jgi:hypothetical protein